MKGDSGGGGSPKYNIPGAGMVWCWCGEGEIYCIISCVPEPPWGCYWQVGGPHNDQGKSSAGDVGREGGLPLSCDTNQTTSHTPFP